MSVAVIDFIYSNKQAPPTDFGQWRLLIAVIY